MLLWSYAMTPAHLAENGVERARSAPDLGLDRAWGHERLWLRLGIFFCDVRDFPFQSSAAALGLFRVLAGPKVDPAERADRRAQVVLVQLGELEANRGVVDLGGKGFEMQQSLRSVASSFRNLTVSSASFR